MPSEYPQRFTNRAVGSVDFDFTHTVPGYSAGYPQHSWGLVGEDRHHVKKFKCTHRDNLGVVAMEAQLYFQPTLPAQDAERLQAYWRRYWNLDPSDRSTETLPIQDRRWIIQQLRAVIDWAQVGDNADSGRIVQQVCESWELGYEADGRPFNPLSRYLDEHVEFFDCAYACEFQLYVHSYLACVRDLESSSNRRGATLTPIEPSIFAEPDPAKKNNSLYDQHRNYYTSSSHLPRGMELSPLALEPVKRGVAFIPVGRGSAYTYQFELDHCPCKSRGEATYRDPRPHPE